MKVIKKCPYECADFYRLGGCEHEQKVRVKEPRAPIVKKQSSSSSDSPRRTGKAGKRRGSLPALFSSFVLGSSPTGGSSSSSGLPSPSYSQTSATTKSSPIPSSMPLGPSATNRTTMPDDSFAIPSFALSRELDELVDVHFELMLRELAVPEKTQKELIGSQSAEQKRRLLRMHMMSHRDVEAGSRREDWVERFAGMRTGSLSLESIHHVMVGLRTAHRPVLERFFGSQGLEKLAGAALETALVQSKRRMNEAQLLLNILGCFDQLSRTQMGLEALVANEEVTLVLMLCSRVVSVIAEAGGTTSQAHEQGTATQVETCIRLSLDIVEIAVNVLVKLGFASTQGASRVFSALERASALMQGGDRIIVYAWTRLLSKGSLVGEPRMVHEKLRRIDAATRLALLRFLNALVEMPRLDRGISRAVFLKQLKELDVPGAAMRALSEIENVLDASSAGDFRTQTELLKALVENVASREAVLDSSVQSDIEANSINATRPELHSVKQTATEGTLNKATAAIPPTKRAELALDTSVCAIPSAAIALHGVIGAGSFGTVHLGTFRGAKVAVKCLHRRYHTTSTQRRPSAATNRRGEAEDHDVDATSKPDNEKITPSRSIADAVLREAQVLGRCQNHPNIVRFFGVSLENDEVRLVFEYCELGSLDDVVVRSPQTVELETVARYGFQTAAGLAHLHSLGVIHRDVAARNVLVDARGVCKVSDFGMARIRSTLASATTSTTSTGGGSNQNLLAMEKTASSSNPLKWAAPESLRDRVFSRASDAWMFGIFIWELWYQSVPFPHLDHFAAGCKVAFESLSPHVDDDRGRLAPCLMAICVSCWHPDPQQRPPMDLLVTQLDEIQRNPTSSPKQQIATTLNPPPAKSLTARERGSPRPPAPPPPAPNSLSNVTPAGGNVYADWPKGNQVTLGTDERV